MACDQRVKKVQQDVKHFQKTSQKITICLCNFISKNLTGGMIPDGINMQGNFIVNLKKWSDKKKQNKKKILKKMQKFRRKEKKLMTSNKSW